MKLVNGEFPHLCPGDGCAICRWIFRSPAVETPTITPAMQAKPEPPKPIVRVLKYRVERLERNGKTWPELVAEVL